MMTSFYNLLKYARTGLASPDMTAYDKARALALAGGYPITTITGIPPLSFKSDGTPLISWSMKGNGQQTGTPSPQNIVPFDGTGERTGNLFDGSGIATSTNDVYVNSDGQMLYFHGRASNPGGRMNPLSNDITLDAGIYRIRAFGQELIQLFLQKKGDGTTYYRFDNSSPIIRLEEQTTFFISCGVVSGTVYGESVGIVLVSGSVTPTSYVPYGWQIPITCAGQTTPVYLGQTPTVRRIKKLVLTGEESYTEATNWKKETTSAYYTLVASGILNHFTTISTLSTHFLSKTRSALSTTDNAGICCPVAKGVAFRVLTVDMPTVADFKAYLAAQYAAGTPVTVWYVLETPETGILNEPLCKIGDYADTLTTTTPIPTAKGSNTLSVDTELQPSEMTITGRIQENV